MRREGINYKEQPLRREGIKEIVQVFLLSVQCWKLTIFAGSKCYLV